MLWVGATIDLACGPDNRTPLQQAAFHGYESVVTFLLEKGDFIFSPAQIGVTVCGLCYCLLNLPVHINIYFCVIWRRCFSLYMYWTPDLGCIKVENQII